MLVPHTPASRKLFGNQIKIVHGLMNAVLADDEAAEFIKKKLGSLEKSDQIGQLKPSNLMDILSVAGTPNRETIVLLSICSDILTIAISALTADRSLDLDELKDASPILSPFIETLADHLDRYSGFRIPLKVSRFRQFLTVFSQDENPFGMRCKGTALSSIQILSISDNLVPRYCAMANYERVLARLIGMILASGGLNSYEKTRERSMLKMVRNARVKIKAIHHIEVDVVLPKSIFQKSIPPNQSDRKPEDLLESLKKLNKGLENLGLSKRNPITSSRHPNSVEERASRNEVLAEALAELQSLCGLDEVRSEIEKLTNLLKVQEVRRERGLPVGNQALHFVFLGNPGTGKTTVARLLGRIFFGLGILDRNKCHEVDRADLVAEYLGQTAIKTNKVIDKAIDGVLFIDEAYSLAGGSERNDHYGKEAIATILKRMEDDRSRLCVIVAGYPEPMTKFLSSNPGLKSRFSRTIEFADYSPEALLNIFYIFASREKYQLSPAFKAKLATLFFYVCQHRDGQFGNARFARNIYEYVLCEHSNRISKEGEYDHASLVTLRSSDLPIEDITGCELDWKNFDWRITCDGCGQTYEGTWHHLWTTLKCIQCSIEFQFDTLETTADIFDQLQSLPPKLPF